jgi:hypothetical protein
MKGAKISSRSPIKVAIHTRLEILDGGGDKQAG